MYICVYLCVIWLFIYKHLCSNWLILFKQPHLKYNNNMPLLHMEVVIVYYQIFISFNK